MKKWIYLLMIFGLFILGGCNLFSGLDEEDLDGSSFDYKLEESMASGDYATVVSLIDNKIAGSSELSLIDNQVETALGNDSSVDWTSLGAIEVYYEGITDYLNNNISNPNVKEYIDLKLTLAEAQLGLSELKMTDIIAQLTEATKSTTKAPSTITIGKLIPAGLDRDSLTAAITTYLISLPSTQMLNDYEINYLNAALSSAISSIHRFLEVFTEDPSVETLVWKSYSTTLQSEWNTERDRAVLEIIAAKNLLNLYGVGSGVIDQGDLDDINANINSILNQIDFDNEGEYNTFRSTIGL